MSEDVYRAISDPTRRVLLERLRDAGEMPSTELGEGLGLTRQAVAKHVDVLAAAGLVDVVVDSGRRMVALRASGLAPVSDWALSFAHLWEGPLPGGPAGPHV